MSLVKKQRTKKQSFRFFFLRLNFVWNVRKNIRKSKSVLSVLNEAFSLILLARKQAPAPRHFTNHCVMSRSEADLRKVVKISCVPELSFTHSSPPSLNDIGYDVVFHWHAWLTFALSLSQFLHRPTKFVFLPFFEVFVAWFRLLCSFKPTYAFCRLSFFCVMFSI